MSYFYVLLLLVGTISVSLLAHVVMADYDNYMRESACVAQHISNGVERRNIVTYDGTCSVQNGQAHGQ